MRSSTDVRVRNDTSAADSRGQELRAQVLDHEAVVAGEGLAALRGSAAPGSDRQGGEVEADRPALGPLDQLARVRRRPSRHPRRPAGRAPRHASIARSSAPISTRPPGGPQPRHGQRQRRAGADRELRIRRQAQRQLGDRVAALRLVSTSTWSSTSATGGCLGEGRDDQAGDVGRRRRPARRPRPEQLGGRAASTRVQRRRRGRSAGPRGRCRARRARPTPPAVAAVRPTGPAVSSCRSPPARRPPRPGAPRGDQPVDQGGAGHDARTRARRLELRVVDVERRGPHCSRCLRHAGKARGPRRHGRERSAPHRGCSPGEHAWAGWDMGSDAGYGSSVADDDRAHPRRTLTTAASRSRGRRAKRWPTRLS